MTLWIKTPCSHCVHMGPHDMFSNEWYAHERGGTERPATVDDIRAQVESGTIKGEVEKWCETHQAESIENHGGPSDECWRVVWADHKADEGLPLTGYGLCRIVERLVVSDGGSET